MTKALEKNVKIMNISFAVTDFHTKTCKVLGILDRDTYTYNDSPAPFVKNTVMTFRSDVWPLIDHTNLNTVQFTLILPEEQSTECSRSTERTEIQTLLQNFTINCTEWGYNKLHSDKIKEGTYPIFIVQYKDTQSE